jgi:hypothetical protein
MSKRLCIQFADPPSEKAMDDIFKKLSSFVDMFGAGVQFLEDEEAKRCASIPRGL